MPWSHGLTGRRSSYCSHRSNARAKVSCVRSPDPCIGHRGARTAAAPALPPAPAMAAPARSWTQRRVRAAGQVPSSRDSRVSDSTIASAEAPGRSTRPNPPAKSVSPVNRIPSSRASRQTEPAVWPGVWSTSSEMDPNRTLPPSASSTAGTDGGIGRLEGYFYEPTVLSGVSDDAELQELAVADPDLRHRRRGRSRAGQRRRVRPRRLRLHERPQARAARLRAAGRRA